jgi:hypothetical protein
LNTFRSLMNTIRLIIVLDARGSTTVRSAANPV